MGKTCLSCDETTSCCDNTGKRTEGDKFACYFCGLKATSCCCMVCQWKEECTATPKCQAKCVHKFCCIHYRCACPTCDEEIERECAVCGIGAKPLEEEKQ